VLVREGHRRRKRRKKSATSDAAATRLLRDLLRDTDELSRLTVLHVDKDFDLIAAITGQPIERLER
jgi:hypothetical protein